MIGYTHSHAIAFGDVSSTTSKKIKALFDLLSGTRFQFDTELYLQADCLFDNVHVALRRLNRLDTHSRVFIFVSGNCFQVNGDVFVSCWDTQANDVPSAHAIAITDLLSLPQTSKAKHIAFIFDLTIPLVSISNHVRPGGHYSNTDPTNQTAYQVMIKDAGYDDTLAGPMYSRLLESTTDHLNSLTKIQYDLSSTRTVNPAFNLYIAGSEDGDFVFRL